MSGHSKWSQIKRQKGITDAAKSRTFSRFARLITIEAKKAGGNLSSPGLVSAIERAVVKGNSKDASALDNVAYEFYGPGGSALIVTALTDNKNRTTQEIKHLLSKNGYELGTPGSALWAFTKSPDGHFTPNEPIMDVTGLDEEKLGIILGLLDEHEDVQEIATNARGYESTEE
jgi:transcriptional/translational regulatory protein YebC/TACO1